MIRKSLIALTAIATVAAAALTPATSASAAPHFHHFHRGFGWYGPAFVGGAILTGAAIAASESCYVLRIVETRRGPRRVWINVC
jgi:hypothetical protein